MRKRMNHQHDHQHDHHTHRRGPGGHGRGRGGGRRASRGAVGQSILTLLDEQPMLGYELITALEERSGGRWRPSPGAIYPALRKLTDKGLITSVEEDGKHRYSLTDDGRQAVSAAAEVGYTEPWAQVGNTSRGELHRAFGELTGPVRQIGRFGTPEQSEAAEAVLKDATAKLYSILAGGKLAE